jgi:type VII secretion-associated serine protease mycosin
VRPARAVAAVLALTAVAAGATVWTAPPAHAVCTTPVAVGAPLPDAAGEEPLIARLGLRRVWELSTGAGVRVAVIDSGVDARHPKLAGAVAPPTDFRTTFYDPRGFEQVPGTGDDCENHGTPIAGIIAGRSAGDDRVLGVAPDATIVPIRFDGPLDQAPDEMIAAAIRLGADTARVLNLSFAVPVDRPVIFDAVRYALDRDVVVVAAAGNENQSQPGLTWYPAAYDGVLAVAGLDDAGQPTEESNRGPWVDVAAPSENLLALSTGGQGYVLVDGTSFATAVVSGVAALVRARYPDLPAAQVVQRIESTAVSLTGGRDERTGAGAVDPYQALTALAVGPPPAAVPDARGNAVSVVPVPVDEPLLSGTGAIAAAATGILLALAGVVAIAGVSARRIAARRGDPEAVAAFRPPDRPLEPVPDIRLD